MGKLIASIIISILIVAMVIVGVWNIISKEVVDINKTKEYEVKIDEIPKDDKEIERKCLTRKDDIPYDLQGKDVHIYDILQTYICFDPEMRVRSYNNGLWYEFTIKTNMTKDGMIRDETNITITKEQYDNLIAKKEGNTISKTRYQLYDDGQLYAFDIFHGDLDGLAYMEIEFPTEEESRNYKEPSWVIKDVTDNINYKNGHLARYGIPAE